VSGLSFLKSLPGLSAEALASGGVQAASVASSEVEVTRGLIFERAQASRSSRL
jgi:hypothetical protein